MEIWKKVEWVNGKNVTTNGNYYISNLGNFKREDRVFKPYFNPDGYLFVDVHIIDSDTGKSKRKVSAIHRLVAVHFIPNSENLPEVNHKNGIKTDNYEDNLEWCTRIYNVKHSWEMGLSKAKIGSERHNAKMDEKTVHEICKLLEKGYSNIEIERMIDNVSSSDVGNIKKRKNWKHVSKYYKFDDIVEAVDRPYTKKDIENVCILIHAGYSNSFILRVVKNLKKSYDPNRLINRIRWKETYRKEYSEVQRLSKPGIRE